MNYLDNGGNLYFESVNIGYDYNTTTFFDYLGIYYQGDGSDNEIVNIKGACSSCTESLKYDYLGGNDPHLSVDRLESDEGALLFSSEDGYGRVFIKETENYKTIASSIVIAAVANADSLNLKPYLFSEYINYFLGYNPVTEMQENLSRFIDGSNFPNPFSDATTINFKINRSSNIRINIYDLTGQLITKLVDKEYKPGDYKVIWDATDRAGNKVDNGFYFYSITGGDDAVNKKMILLQ